MSNLKQSLNSILNSIQKITENLIGRRQFCQEFKKFKILSKSVRDQRFKISWNNRYPCLKEKTSTTEFDQHYIYHTAWAARILAKNKPRKHIDIGSRLYFSTLVSAFIPMTFYDYRPAKITLSNLQSKKANLLSLHFTNNSLTSLSCMHTVEHVGLGRYGDPLDPQGDLRAIKELKRVMAKKGNLLFVVPIGKAKLMFNAHRIYSYKQIVNYFKEFNLKLFSLVKDSGDFINYANQKLANAQNYGCGCFWFQKLE